ncbi:MAG TPA: Os1348 family NHLP clan protein [Candidatus Acidoferrales bacterium]|nr:Os1348 family NHLP clan protein [Candidatus Acidoferrales bacterium]HXK02530.1 Os1348 family NHLP clan protein [Verrucomicrobiae bacterium]
MATQDDKPAGHGLMELLGRALVDPKLRDHVFKDPHGVAKQYQLGPQDVEALQKLDRAKFDEAASGLSGRADVRITIAIRGHFNAQ